MLADEMPNARFVEARSIVEWRATPDRLNQEAVTFVTQCWSARDIEPGRSSGRAGS